MNKAGIVDVKRTVLFILGALLLVLLIQNTEVVSFRVFFWQISMSRIILLPLVMLVGFLIGFIVGKRSWDW